MILENIPTHIGKMILEIESLINSHFPQRNLTLPVKIRKRKNNTTVMWNIYPIDNIQLKGLFQSLINIIEQNFHGIKGEILSFNLVEGKISDTGVQEFKIIEGKSWDVYLYDPEIFIYSRLLIEFQLSKPEKKWISVDIDIIEESAWFSND